jgi:hypothetical protein
MNEKEFVAKREKLENTISEARKAIYALEKEYIATNQPFPIGTKVKVTTTNEFDSKGFHIFAIVRDYELCGDVVKPVLAKINKDGSMHKSSNYWVSWWRKPVIEVCKD